MDGCIIGLCYWYVEFKVRVLDGDGLTVTIQQRREITIWEDRLHNAWAPCSNFTPSPSSRAGSLHKSYP